MISEDRLKEMLKHYSEGDQSNIAIIHIQKLAEECLRLKAIEKTAQDIHREYANSNLSGSAAVMWNALNEVLK